MSVVQKNLVIRHPTLQDAAITLALMLAYDVAEFGEEDSSLSDLQDQWADINLNQDAWLVFDPHERLTGYAAVFGGGRRFTFEHYLHPSLAPDGLMNAMLAQCERRARERMASGSEIQAAASIIISEKNQKSRQIAQQLGYRPFLYHFGMQIEFAAPPAPPAWPEGLTLRTVIPGQDDQMVYDFIQAAFERPGRSAPTFQDWRDFMLGASNFEPGLWFLAFHAEQLVGAALCFEYPQRGWVRQLAVKQAWRRQGLGAAFLQYVFGTFYQRGQTQVGLVVDSDNPKAYQFYEKVGMKCQRNMAEYRKMISNP